MTVPKFTEAMRPIMELAEDGNEHSIREAIDAVSELFHLSEEEKNRRLPSGTGTYIKDRTSWALTYLSKAQLLERTKRGYFRITRRGLDLMAEKPERIDLRTLEKFEEFVSFKNLRTIPKTDSTNSLAIESVPETPTELMETGYANLQASLTQELLDKIKANSPRFFEELVVELMLKMGYGGFREDAGDVTGKPGDGGIDGIINEDRLGIDAIHIQAKKWEGPVGRPELQRFVGALQGKGANKGIFVTSSTFSDEAKKYAQGNLRDIRLVTIDGRRLAELMIEFGIGVTKVKSYDIMKLDTDYFDE